MQHKILNATSEPPPTDIVEEGQKLEHSTGKPDPSATASEYQSYATPQSGDTTGPGLPAGDGPAHLLSGFSAPAEAVPSANEQQSTAVAPVIIVSDAMDTSTEGIAQNLENSRAGRPTTPSTIDYDSAEDDGSVAMSDVDMVDIEHRDRDGFGENAMDLEPEDVVPETPVVFPQAPSVASLPRSGRSRQTAQSNHRTGYDQLDILPQIKGMFRLLDLYSESGSGGLVDKIIIDQVCLRDLINNITPKAYHSLTRIDFAKLDYESLKIIGIYGSRSEIVSFLHSLGIITDRTASLLLLPAQQQSQFSHPSLRSGLYFVFTPSQAAPALTSATREAFVIYWPEETTWDDKAIGAVRKNRVTFTRYLTRLCDQVVALISPDHGSKLVWKSTDVDDEIQDLADFGMEEDDHAAANSDRFFEFEVVMTKEQDEGVTIAPGFSVMDPRIISPSMAPDRHQPSIIQPRLVTSECRQAFLTGKICPAQVYTQKIKESFTAIRLKSELATHSSILIHESVTLEGMQLLINEGGLKSRAVGLCSAWSNELSNIKKTSEAEYRAKLATIKDNEDASSGRLELAIRIAVCREFAAYYQGLDASHLYRPSKTTQMDFAEASDHLSEVLSSYPFLGGALQKSLDDAKLGIVISNPYKHLKKRFRMAKHFLDTASPSPEKRKETILMITHPDEDTGGVGKSRVVTFAKRLLGFGSEDSTSDAQSIVDIAEQPDPEFINGLVDIVNQEPMFEEAVQQLQDLALSWAQKKVNSLAASIVGKTKFTIQNTCQGEARRVCDLKIKTETDASFLRFRDKFCPILAKHTSGAGLSITRVQKGDWSPRYGFQGHETELHAHFEVRVDPTIEYGLHILELTQEDKQQVREDPQFVPKPRVHASTSFHLPVDSEIRHIQLLGTNRCLIVVGALTGLAFYLSESTAPARGNPTKQLPHIQGDTIFAVDESKRLLAMIVMNTGKLVLQLFAFDEGFSTIHSRGSPQNVTQWYQDGSPKIRLACFISGTEELCLLEESGRIRSFSFISQTFRPATIQLSTTPLNLFSSPDGSALIVVEADGDDGFRIRAFHTATLGSNNVGIIPIGGPAFKDAATFGVTSLEHRNNPHILSLSLSGRSISSASLQISKKTTDFQYLSKDRRQSTNEQKDSDHNSLIDCLADVWTRYPVVPAIKRDPISADTRIPSSVTYVVEGNHERFRPYFKQMIRDFEASTHKPTDRRLDAIAVHSYSFNTFLTSVVSNANAASSFRAGEWLVELLCLIPIHIAIARENRFVPLNNGVIDPALEQRLLGAEVSQIVDALTLGWYESIFNSYLATKPVKVISSMGEQSVGKSYALNHIVDSSFAGSAVRTTEGVWLSVCPSRDLLVVALDFEGVHSIERTPQEDMLLVLFNTALSNMILFRNNFALSRDVANMFTSFQSSTSVLDPASNPQLFKGLLVVIIKDVVDADKNEIVKEFRSKFTQIVTEEQGTNFITLLHDGQNLVVPWPVIQSRSFYTLFSGLRVKLLHQATTHRTAGEFLMTLKTLMAKLKAQDWGSLDQNITKHRVGTLTTLLPTAIATGFTELDPEPEPLKNLENQSLIQSFGDAQARFCVSKSSEQNAAALSSLIDGWNTDAARHNVAELERHLQNLVQARILHVREWLTINLERFSSENADVRGLKREFEDACEKLRSSVQICRADCASCRLPCLLNKLHERSTHDCGTSHQCLNECGFPEEHQDDEVPCHLPAGHSGRHMCDPTAHCCGLPCELNGRKGCQGVCMRAADHADEEHMCSARVHQCGQPCDLRDIQGVGTQKYSCPNHCTLPHDEEHDSHSCGDSLPCPIQCELCPRLCSMGDHFHGLEKGATHLCGQEHSCGLPCAASGICEINTAPRSVETTFVGVYETFQYTKYTQVAKRLPCAIPIQPGERGHVGKHVHSAAPDLFHFCQVSCPNCGYICTLPLGHTQAEHETSHGSMDNTAWAIEGAVDAAVEVQGRKYAPQDAGAPHMCNLVCSHQGRHAHIDYCRADDPQNCQEEESLHIDVEMVPNKKQHKDWMSHARFWKRTGFRDPYPKDEQSEFACCDVQCAGAEHEATTTQPARPSFCTLPIFHPPQPLNWNNPNGQGYVSSDGHAFPCVNPNSLRQAFHVIFVLDRSGSMSLTDRRPLPNTPSSAAIARNNNNRLGAVLSALQAFWTSRNVGVTAASPRRDAYSVVLFDHASQVLLQNDFTSTPEELLNRLLTGVNLNGGTNFDQALNQAQRVMETNWSTDLSPVIIFLSDGECAVSDTVLYDLCNRAVALGKPLSLHAVSFGTVGYSAPLRRMAHIGNEVSQNAPRSALAPLVPCTYSDAIDTIRLAETFMTIAESLKKPRASLIRA